MHPRRPPTYRPRATSSSFDHFASFHLARSVSLRCRRLAPSPASTPACRPRPLGASLRPRALRCAPPSMASRLKVLVSRDLRHSRSGMSSHRPTPAVLFRPACPPLLLWWWVGVRGRWPPESSTRSRSLAPCCLDRDRRWRIFARRTWLDSGRDGLSTLSATGLRSRSSERPA